VAGHRGMAEWPSAGPFAAREYGHVLDGGRADELPVDPVAVEPGLPRIRPDVVVLGGGEGGAGFWPNSTYPADFLLENLKIPDHVHREPGAMGRAGCLFSRQQLQSTEIRPPADPEEFAAHRAIGSHQRLVYAIARSPGIELLRGLRQQHGFDLRSGLMAHNSMALGDNYHPTNSLVLPGPDRRFPRGQASRAGACHLLARQTRCAEVFCTWDDLADAGVFLPGALAAGDHRGRSRWPLQVPSTGTGPGLCRSGSLPAWWPKPWARGARSSWDTSKSR